MSIAPRIVTPVDVSNPVIFEHLHDVYTSEQGVDKTVYYGDEGVEKD